MSFLSLFRRKKTIAEHKSNTESAILSETVAVDKSLFLDDQQPANNTTISEKNAVEVFLNQNFEWQGHNDGYRHPDSEFLQHKLSWIRSEFRLAVDKCLDSRRSEVHELKMHLIQCSGISPKLEAQVAEKIKQVEGIIHELDTQKILSIENEGILASTIHAYRLGFIKGVEQFQREKLLAGSTGLFK